MSSRSDQSDDARARILTDVRAAVHGAPPAPDIDRGYRTGISVERESLVDRFASRVEDYRAVVTRCAAAEVERHLTSVLDGSLPPGATVIVPDGLAYGVHAAAVVEVESTGRLLSRDAIESAHAVVTGATLGIAETGTIVLDHGPGQGRRVLSLLPDFHICVVLAETIVQDVPDAVARLDPRRPLTWVSGPSATSDIELNRIEGVHGPRRLHVVVVD